MATIRPTNFLLIFGVVHSSVVFPTHESTGVDTRIAGLRRIQAELYQFEEISKMAAKMAS